MGWARDREECGMTLPTLRAGKETRDDMGIESKASSYFQRQHRSPMNMSPTWVWVNLDGSILESTQVKKRAEGSGLSRTRSNSLTIWPLKVFLYLTTPESSLSMPRR